MGTLIRLTTIATLATCVQVNMDIPAFAAGQVSNSTGNFTAGRSTSTASNNLSLENYSQYEPDPNGNPKSDGTGTR
ncbi:MAG: hypothetical protein EAZ78_14365 [Oscillatoriales cyanobacterium]|uniref:Uncharacterized protein n=1 Tax=Microcoleus anatoxicus PTRS2 TaxID=2705321 RepID=A0ABU8YKK8_9CYAN|nr:MAG: hypothetical protein EA000_15405 [Oscillatoriales cyanobacterium]TAD95849.1 MAG: hypothetical protein EAZ98_14265 [Oscillatoriales cyanobacterium]TAE03492.1 MAG: hypothetical protein EAZ96_12665 [Oscillatoriales cyanobacterium]TAF02792.1 MAG: hypothetical protein EAZ78_14365 [Oscillatoriales cyanobacterium]TAF71136.1 MAG: hypothetical protein EAZ59_02240 [Oscillatoriales cyanobacterium]